MKQRTDRMNAGRRRVIEFEGPAGELLEFGLLVTETLRDAASSWGGSVKARPEDASPAATFSVDADGDAFVPAAGQPLAGQSVVRVIVTLATAGLTVGEDYHCDLWVQVTGEAEPQGVFYGHVHPLQRVTSNS